MAKVKNLNRTRHKKCKCAHHSTWLNHWENHSGKKSSMCKVKGCNRKAKVGAHVKKVRNDHRHYIIPLCNEHNRCSYELDVYYIELVTAECIK